MRQVSTLIGYGSPNKADTHDVHGAPLGKDETAATRANLKWPYGEFEASRSRSLCQSLVVTNPLAPALARCLALPDTVAANLLEAVHGWSLHALVEDPAH